VVMRGHGSGHDDGDETKPEWNEHERRWVWRVRVCVYVHFVDTWRECDGDAVVSPKQRCQSAGYVALRAPAVESGVYILLCMSCAYTGACICWPADVVTS
jgi:hypothetical protein